MKPDTKNFKNVNHVEPYGRFNNLIKIECDPFNPKEKHEIFFLNKNNEVVAHFENKDWLFADLLSDKNNSIYDISKGSCGESENIEQIVKVNPDLSYDVLHEVEYIECGIEDDSFAIRKNGLYGFIDYNGEEFIKPQYEKYHAFHLGIACVKKDGKWGFINKQNEAVIPFIYDMPEDCYYYPKQYEDKILIPVKKEDKYGIVDVNNNIVIPFEYEEISFCFYSNYFEAKKNGKTGVVDLNQNIILPFEYDEGEGDTDLYPYNLMAKNGLTGLINDNIEFIVPCEYKELTVNDNSIVAKKQNDKYVLLNLEGKEISEEFDYIYYYSKEGLYCAGNNKKYGFIDDKTGKIVIPFKYRKQLFGFEGSLAEVELPDSVEIIDKKGKVLYSARGYRNIFNLGNGCILTENDEIIRLI